MSLVDVASTATACQHLAAWWQDFKDGKEDLYRLEAARRSLQRLTPQPGPVGDAVNLIATGGRGANGDQLVGAIKLLTRVAAWQGQHKPAQATRRRAPQASSGDQQPLPGLETS